MTELEDGTKLARARVKLQHDFGPWNLDADGNYGPKNSGLGGLDMVITYISSIFHFHLKVENKRAKDLDPGVKLNPSEDYNKTTKDIKIGNYISNDSKDKLDFVDIGGEDYTLGVRDDKEIKEPTTTTLPLGLWTGEQERHETVMGNTETAEDDYSSDVSAEADYGVMLYGVCYPDFDGTGKGIWHDPTFSVYMIITPEATVAIALILLVGGVGLVGIATILIKKKKNRRY